MYRISLSITFPYLRPSVILFLSVACWSIKFFFAGPMAPVTIKFCFWIRNSKFHPWFLPKVWRPGEYFPIQQHRPFGWPISPVPASGFPTRIPLPPSPPRMPLLLPGKTALLPLSPPFSRFPSTLLSRLGGRVVLLFSGCKSIYMAKHL